MSVSHGYQKKSTIMVNPKTEKKHNSDIVKVVKPGG